MNDNSVVRAADPHAKNGTYCCSICCPNDIFIDKNHLVARFQEHHPAKQAAIQSLLEKSVTPVFQ